MARRIPEPQQQRRGPFRQSRPLFLSDSFYQICNSSPSHLSSFSFESTQCHHTNKESMFQRTKRSNQHQQQQLPNVAHQQHNPFVGRVTSIKSTLVCLLLTGLIFFIEIDLCQAALNGRECNFEKYATGCYSQANFVCDRETNLCRCHPELPILIDQRICVKKAKVHEICQYDDQCDNSNGFHCLYRDQNHHKYELCKPFDSVRHLTEPQLKCRCSRLPQQQKSRHNSNTDSSASNGADASDSFSGQQFWPQYSEFPTNNNKTYQQTGISPASQPSSQHSYSFLPRLIWIFLILTLIGLLALLFLIRFQPFTSDRAFHQHHQADDRQSINSEPDVPPPYEVAIRMKL